MSGPKRNSGSSSLEKGEQAMLEHQAPSPAPAPAGAPARREAHLRRDITRRQMLLMALGGSIGAGLWVASGAALAAAGPGTLLVDFAVTGLMVLVTMANLGELATAYPVAGAFYDYSLRFISPAWGFAMGWNFAFNWLIILPFELTILSVMLGYYAPGLSLAAFVAPFLVFLAFVGLMGAGWFAELEHWAGAAKAAALAVFIAVAVAITARGLPGDPRGRALGAEYWRAGAFRHGFRGFVFVSRVAGMAYGGTEVLGLAAAETRSPRRTMPLAVKVVFFRVAVLYLGSLLMLGFVLRADDVLVEGAGHPHASPFVRAMEVAGQPALADFFRVMIIVAVVSMANVAIFSSSRALQALCARGMGPRRLGRIAERRGLPVYALAVAVAFGLLAFVGAAPRGTKLFEWLLSLAGVSNYYTWASICLSQIRMRRGMRAQGHGTAALVWRSPFGEWGSWVALAICAWGLVAPICSTIWPVGGEHDAEAGVRDCIGIVVVLACWAGYVWWHKAAGQKQRLLIPLREIDLATGLRPDSPAEEED